MVFFLLIGQENFVNARRLHYLPMPRLARHNRRRIVITGLAANLWHVDITGDAAGTEATPFANTVA